MFMVLKNTLREYMHRHFKTYVKICTKDPSLKTQLHQTHSVDPSLHTGTLLGRVYNKLTGC